jgi:hypothetical protein
VSCVIRITFDFSMDDFLCCCNVKTLLTLFHFYDRLTLLTLCRRETTGLSSSCRMEEVIARPMMIVGKAPAMRIHAIGVCVQTQFAFAIPTSLDPIVGYVISLNSCFFNFFSY